MSRVPAATALNRIPVPTPAAQVPKPKSHTVTPVLKISYRFEVFGYFPEVPGLWASATQLSSVGLGRHHSHSGTIRVGHCPIFARALLASFLTHDFSWSRSPRTRARAL